MDVEAILAVTRSWYEEWNSEGLLAFERFWAPDVVLYEAPEFPETGIFRGAEALSDYLRELVEGGGHFQDGAAQPRGARGLRALHRRRDRRGPDSGAAVTTPFHPPGAGRVRAAERPGAMNFAPPPGLNGHDDASEAPGWQRVPRGNLTNVEGFGSR